MAQISQRQELKRREVGASLFCHEDGLMDIIVGLIAMGFGLMIASDKLIFWLIFYIVGIGVWRASKQWITYPGPDRVKSPQKRKTGKPILIGMIMANLLLIFVLALILLNLKGLAA